jgi:hypothetical protein
MTKRVLLALSHSIEEHDQLKLLSGLGYEVASIGGYINPAHPHDPKRPALPEVPYFPEVQKAVDDLGMPDNLGAAQERIPDAILDWLGDDGIIVFHHYLDRLYKQWPRIRDWKTGARRVIWRSVGQSVQGNELTAVPFRKEGLERVAYSPKEANIPGYSGHDALIRFYGDPQEWCGWTGEKRYVLNITQHLRQRDPYTNWRYWDQATNGLPTMPAGPGSEQIGGPGELSYEEMRQSLREARCYLYTGTQPASYTLGLIEAMMTGIPVVSIGPAWMGVFPYGPDLFEGHELATDGGDHLNDPAVAHRFLKGYLEDPSYARAASVLTRDTAIKTFGKDTIAAQWRAFLGAP